MSGKIKVLVADDSGLMRLIISDIINSENDMEVIDTAEDGKQAVEKAIRLNPDVVLLDMTMGQYDGIYAVKNILKRVQIPIVILSAMGNSNIEPILDALKLGAFDYLNKPEANKAKVRDIANEIVAKVRLAAYSNKKYIEVNKSEIKQNQNNHSFNDCLNYDVVVIGSSTGGPTAIERVITKLPANLPVPVLIAQHMPENFVPSFVNRLNTTTPLEVVLGRAGDELKKGFIYVAPGNRNMIIEINEHNKPVIGFTPTRYKEFNNPSVNALMLSVVSIYGKRTIGVILTGMGKDGANGMEEIKKQGGYTIAQDKETSAVYGMPKEVADRNCVNSVVSIYEMGGFIVSCLS